MIQGVQFKPFAQVILLTALLLLSDLALSQTRTGEYTIETIPYTGQLSGFSGTCFLQDRDGFMWFGSTSGLYRYDGKNFKVFRNDPQDENSISSDEIRTMIEDEDGFLWIGTRWGLNRFDKRTESFRRFFSQRGDSSSLIHNRVNTLYQEDEQIIWIGGVVGIGKFDKSLESFTSYLSFEEWNMDKKMIRNIFSILLQENVIWVISAPGDFWRFDMETGVYNRVENTPCPVMNMKLDSRGRFWIAGEDGMYLFNTGSLTFRRVLSEPGDPNRLKNQSVRSIFEDKSGQIWIRTLDGLYQYNHEMELLFIYEHPQPEVNKLAEYFMTRNICEDQMGTIWFFTGEGIIKCYKSNYQFNISHPDLYVCGGIEVENESSLWFGTMNGLYHFDCTQDAYTHYPLINPEEINVSLEVEVSEVHKDQEGSLWIGTWAGGLFKLDHTNKDSEKMQRYLHIPGDSSSIPGDVVWQIIEDQSGRVWISGFDQNPCYYDQEGNRMIHLVHNPSSGEHLPSNSIIFHESSGNQLWALGDSAVYKVMPPFRKISDNAVSPKNVFRYADLVIGGKKRYWMDIICAMFMDSNGIVWLGTPSHGLIKMVEGKVESYTTNDGLLSNRILSIMEDDSGFIWLGLPNGMSKFDPGTEIFTNYTSQHGLPPAGFIVDATCKRNGELFFGTQSGMVSFHPDSLKHNNTIPPVFITDLKIDNQSIISEEFADLRNSFIAENEIELAYHQNFLSIEFAVLNYILPENNQFKYRLDGLEDEWVYCGNRNYATYSSIRPGKYVFMVSGSNNDGIWNETGKTLQIIIRNPPWFSWWAYIIYGLIMLVLIRWYRGLLIKRERINADLSLKEMEVNKMQEIDHMKSRFFSNISHEFRTPLTLLLGPIEELKKNLPALSTKNEILVRTIRNNARRLQHLVNQLLDISKLETGKVKIQVSKGNIAKFIKAIAQSFQSLAEGKSISYEYDLPDISVQVYFDHDKLEKILSNLISNAFKFTDKGGIIRIELDYISSPADNVPEYVVVRVIDSGRGIPANQLERIFERFYQVDDGEANKEEGSGIGLALTKELMDLCRGETHVESEVGKGSRFTVKFPVSKGHFGENEIVNVSSGYNNKAIGMSIDSAELTKSESGVNESGVKDKDAPEVLIVEDSTDLREFLSRNLSSRYHIMEAENGIVGLRKATEMIPDLVITDLMMPEMDGMELCTKLKNDLRTSHIPVIILTAKADRESMLKGLDAEADDYLSKPFDTEELKARVKNLINQRQKLRKKFRLESFTGSDEKAHISPQDQLLQKIVDILNQNISDPEFNMDKMSGELLMSRRQLFRKVHALTGYTPNELLRHMRLKKAVSLFDSGQDNIAQVMYLVGFNNHSYFAKCFRELYQINPSDYLKSKAHS